MDEIYTYGFDLAVEEWNPTGQFFFNFQWHLLLL